MRFCWRDRMGNTKLTCGVVPEIYLRFGSRCLCVCVYRNPTTVRRMGRLNRDRTPRRTDEHDTRARRNHRVGGKDVTPRTPMIVAVVTREHNQRLQRCATTRLDCVVVTVVQNASGDGGKIGRRFNTMPRLPAPQSNRSHRTTNAPPHTLTYTHTRTHTIPSVAAAVASSTLRTENDGPVLGSNGTSPVRFLYVGIGGIGPIRAAGPAQLLRYRVFFTTQRRSFLNRPVTLLDITTIWVVEASKRR